MTATLTRRGYVVEGRTLPRVSTILACIHAEGLWRWKLKVGAEEAARISGISTALGTRVHSACEQVNRGVVWEPAPGDEDLAPFVAAYQRWFAANVAEVISAERSVYSLRLGYGGTLDMLLRLKDGRIALGDLKTSKSLSETYPLQLAAYALALEEMSGLVVDGRCVVNLPSDRPGFLRTVEYPDHEADRLAWRCTVQLFSWLQQHKNDWRRQP